METCVSLDTCCKIQGLGISRKGRDNEKQQVSHNDAHIELCVLRGRIFEVFLEKFDFLMN